jgi:hypothetical protein
MLTLKELLQTYQINYMQTERKVFEKLFSPDKVEFESQKVEFGLIEDVRSQLDKAFPFTEIQSEIIAIENKIKKALPIYESVIKQTEDGVKKLKDLGVDGGLIASLNKQNTEAKNGLKSAQAMISYLQKAI